MIIDKIGKYILQEDKSYRTPNSVFTLTKNTVVDVVQIDNQYHKFYSPLIGDWQYWEQPFKEYTE